MKVSDGDRLSPYEILSRIGAGGMGEVYHPNIAAIHGLEEADGVLALVLELVEGEDLARRSKQFTPGFGPD